jgi:N-methylhydantoinase B/oxoprolinase/acetone carboxylase alpha subunit
VERTKSAPRGFLGGGDGRPARLLVDGKPVDLGQPFTLHQGQVLTLETPGGGGYGAPADRPQVAGREDAIAGVETSSA